MLLLKHRKTKGDSKMVMDSNFICHLKNGYYAFKGAKNYLAIGEQLAYVFTLDLPVLFAVKRNNYVPFIFSCPIR